MHDEGQYNVEIHLVPQLIPKSLVCELSALRFNLLKYSANLNYQYRVASLDTL